MSSEIVPIFSGGIGRSGTTIVARILRQHPSIFGGSPNEIKFLTETYGLIDLVFGLRTFVPTQIQRSGYLASKMPINKSQKFRFYAFRKRLLGKWWNRTNRLGVESGIHRSMPRKTLLELLDKLEVELKTDSVKAGREFLFDFIRNHKKFTGQKYWIDTSTSNIMYANHLHKLLPEARFIEMRRHPLDNLSSVLLEPWGPATFEKALPWFRDRIRLQDKARENVPREQFELIWLEDLVKRDRERTYQKLLELVDIEDHPDMRRYFETEVLPERAHIGRWKQSFNNHERIRAEFINLVGPIDDSLIED